MDKAKYKSLKTLLRDLSEKAFKKKLFKVLEVQSESPVKKFAEIKHPHRYVCTVSPDDKYKSREYDAVPVRACTYSTEGRIKDLAAIINAGANAADGGGEPLGVAAAGAATTWAGQLAGSGQIECVPSSAPQAPPFPCPAARPGRARTCARARQPVSAVSLPCVPAPAN